MNKITINISGKSGKKSDCIKKIIDIDNKTEAAAFCKLIITAYYSIVMTDELRELYNKCWDIITYDPNYVVPFF